MKPMQNTLTEAELPNLLEGDVSDVHLVTSDDVLDLVCDRNKHAVPTSPVVPGLDPEMVEVQKGEEQDLDDVPLRLRFEMSLSGDAEVQVVPPISHSWSRCNPRWHMTDIEEVEAVCDTSFSDPPVKKLSLSNTSNKRVETE